MIKKLVLAAAVACALAAPSAALAAEGDAAGASVRQPTETSKFSYTVEGDELRFSLQGSLNKGDSAAQSLFAVYDGETLLTTYILNYDRNIESLKVRDFTITLPYVPEDMTVKSFLWKADGSCEPLDGAAVLSDIPGTVYECYGTVTGISQSQSSGLRKGEVSFSVEKSDNFNGTPVEASSMYNITANTGDTDISEHMYEYVRAYILKDEDSGAYTIMRYELAAPEQTVTFKATEVADDDDDLITFDWNGIYTGYVANMKLPVYKDSSSTSTTKYNLQRENGFVTTEFYVNGVGLGTVTDELITRYIINNPTGNVKLIDRTSAGSTSTDGYYEYIMVTYYVDAVVDSIQTSSTFAKIYFKNFDSTTAGFRASSMLWDPNDEDIDITITKDGEEIAYTDLEEYDVLSIAYNVEEASGLNDLEYYDIRVSSNTVSGTVTSRDTDDHTVRIDGSDYKVVESLVDETEMELDTNYILYLDTFGYVAYFDEGVKDYGVIVAMYTPAGKDNPTVRMITSTADVVDYECKDLAEANKFYSYATTGRTNGATYNGIGFTKSDIKEQIMAGETVCTYTVTGGKVRFKDAISGYGGNNLEFKANSSKLGTYFIKENMTQIIDMDDYMHSSNSRVYPVAVSDFKDAVAYNAYVFDKNSAGAFRFAIVFEGLKSVTPDYPLAVVQQISGEASVDGVACTELKVAVDGEETYIYTEESLCEAGDVIAYVENYEGYVEAGDLYVLMPAESSYDGLSADTLNRDEFTKALRYTTAVEDRGTKYAITYTQSHVNAVENNDTAKDVYVYFGPVYMKSDRYIEICTGQTDGTTDVFAQTAAFAFTDSTTSYICDYANTPDNRVSTGELPDSPVSRFNAAYEDEDGTVINWAQAAEAGITPDYALIMEIDGRLAEVIGYLSPERYTPSEEPDEPRDYGVITEFGRNDEGIYSITLAADDGELKALTFEDEELAGSILNIIAPEHDGAVAAFQYTKTDLEDRILSGETVIAYTVSEDTLVYAEKLTPYGGDGMEYNAISGRLGPCFISDESTKIIDLSGYMKQDRDQTERIYLEMLENGGAYHAYLFDRSSSGEYQFGIVLEDVTSIRQDSDIAVVVKSNSMTTVDGIDVYELVIAKGTRDDITLLSADSAAEGDIISYTIGTDGYVESGDLYKLYSPDSSYANLLVNTLNLDEFTKAISYTTATEDRGTKYAITYTQSHVAAVNANDTSKDVYVYFGPVYKKQSSNLEIFLSKDGVTGVDSRTATVESFSVASANQFIYDYSQKVGARVTVGSATQTTSVFSTYAYVDGSGKNYLSWQAVVNNNISPIFAFVKEVDGDVTDVIYFIGELPRGYAAVIAANGTTS